MKYRILTVFCILCMGLLSAQVSIDTAFNRYVQKTPAQKIHLHFDNHYYSPGQTIWFKAYFLSWDEPAALGRNMYINWYDENGRYLGRTVSPIINASANSSFTIPLNYKGRKLEAVAFTQWMLNFDSAFLCRKQVLVSQPETVKKQPVNIRSVSLQFFPEGGDMVEGLLTTLAFKATDASGYPVAVSGIIKARNGEQITDFGSRHNGMGIVKFIPEANEEYTAEWTGTDNKMHKTILPPVKQKGIQLTVGKGFADRPFQIQRTESVAEPLKKGYLVVQSQGRIVFRAGINLTDKTEISGILPASGFPSGIAQVTVFDLNWQPIAERIFFVNNHEYAMNTILRVDTISTIQRGKNILEITAADTIPASYSVSVTDERFGYSADNTIITDFLLSGDIKGYVHNPAYYFSSGEDSVAGQLDLVMLTNGWRRFRWNEIMDAQAPALSHTIDTGYLSVRGKVSGVSDAVLNKAKNVNLVLMAKDSSKQYLNLPIAADGSFEKYNLLFYDTIKIYYQLNNTPLYNKSRFQFIDNFMPADTTGLVHVQDLAVADLLTQKLPDSLRTKMAFAAGQTTLQEVVVNTRVKSRKEELEDTYTTGFFKGDDAYQFNIVDDKIGSQSLSVFHYLQSKVAGLVVNINAMANVSLSWRGYVPSFYLDEFPVTDMNTLFNLNMNQIAYIKVFRPPFLGSFIGGGAGGAIALYTKKGPDMMKSIKGMDTTALGGYTMTKEFYSPDYSLTNDKNIRDIRPTLYWNANMATDGDNRKIRFGFYNNDITRRFRVVLEGLNNEGKLVHISKLLE